MVDINRDKQIEAIQIIQAQIVDEVRLAQSVDDGYLRRFKVSKLILGNTLNLSVEEGVLNIRYLNQDYAKYLPQPMVGGFCYNNSDQIYFNVTVSKNAGLVSLSSCTDCRYSYAVCMNAEKNSWCDWLSQPSLFPGLNETCCSDNCLCC